MIVDEAKILLGKDIPIAEGVTIRQPSLEEIIDFGENEFNSTFYTLCSIPSDMKSILWENGKDYTKMSDFDLFISLTRTITADQTRLILGDLDLSSLEPIEVGDENGKMVILWNEESKVLITEEIYEVMISYIRKMFNIVPKVEKAANTITKMVLIQEDKDNRKRNENKQKGQSMIVPYVVSLVNTEEFSYDYESVMGITMYKLSQSVEQINKKKHACALLQGSMSGFVDTSKIKQSSFQWMYEGKAEAEF